MDDNRERDHADVVPFLTKKTLLQRSLREKKTTRVLVVLSLLR